MMNVQRLGWVIAAAVLGVLIATGFQGGFEKIATVDLSTMVETSDFGKSNIAALETMKNSREGLLKFIDENRVITVDQVKNLRTLWLKDAPTSADTATLERLKADVTAMEKKNIELGTQKTLTPEERTLLQEYANRSAASEQLANQWFDEFRQEIQQSAQQRRADTLIRAKAAAQAAAKAGAYTLVFDSSVAVYAANDLTDESLKAMNAKK
jgi:Skp family chaperone for outer membrane proteins